MADVKILLVSIFSALLSFACNPSKTDSTIIAQSFNQSSASLEESIIVGADRIALYYPMLADKNVAVVVNQTSMVGKTHLVDTLISMGVEVQKVFSPEHGFRGEADAGAIISDGKDAQTGLPIISLYGKNKKPSPEQLEGIDIVVFDIQDVGVRFYTYISTMSLVMEACAESAIPIIVLDRPNPNGHYVDGPVLKKEFTSFIGMHPVPVVYGMTIGEYAKMVNGEGWLTDGLACALTVIPCKSYTHNTYYNLPVAPSPNLPNIQSILLYPSLCFFEGTVVSVGRGTQKQFQQYGHPAYPPTPYSFTPISGFGAKYPKNENKECFGVDLSTSTKGSLFDQKALNLDYILDAYSNMGSEPASFFLKNNFFEKLAGTQLLREQIIAQISAEEIRQSWEKDLADFKEIRANYLLYP